MTDKDRADRLAARCESQRLKIAELESKLAGNFCDYADTLKAQAERIKELEEALRELLADTQHAEHAQDGKCDDFCPVLRARAALEELPIAA